MACAITKGVLMRAFPWLFLFISMACFANDRVTPLLDESEYRTSLEEVVVTGQVPEWRKPAEEVWRPGAHELRGADLRACL